MTANAPASPQTITSKSAGSRSVFKALLERPADSGAAFCVEGSQRVQFLLRRREEIARLPATPAGSLLGHVLGEEREALLELETAFDAVGSIWTGMEVRRAPASSDAAQSERTRRLAKPET